MAGSVFQARVAVRERGQALAWFAAGAALLSALLVELFGTLPVPALALLLAIAAIASSYAAIRWALQRRRKDMALVRAENGVLSVDGERRVRRVATAYVQPRPGNASTVRVVGTWFERVDVSTSDEASAHELLRALAVDPARSITRFRVYAGIVSNKTAQTALSAVLGFGAFNAFNLLPVAWKIPGAIALLVLSMLNWAPSNVAVGPDGLLVTSPSRLRRKFIAFADIESAATTSWGVTLVLRSQRTIELRTENQARSRSETRDALLARIQAGIAAVDPSASAVTASLLARAGRPFDEWMRALEGVTRPAGGYRIASVPAEKLWRVVEDPAADPTARAGAAAALSGSLDDDGRTRLRVLAENAVHPHVRVALEAIASADEERVREALEACVEEEAS
ncbi:MAG TPA: hypothetical protein VGH28_20180 [Polyangiaceae bacterium]